MARIQILDLPRLQDLTEEQLKELFGAGPMSFKPSLETLEDRLCMSAAHDARIQADVVINCNARTGDDRVCAVLATIATATYVSNDVNRGAGHNEVSGLLHGDLRCSSRMSIGFTNTGGEQTRTVTAGIAV